MNGPDESRPPEFWAPRRSFLPLIPEIEIATDLIDAAADAYLEKDWEKSEKLIREADFGVLREYAQRILGANDPEIHRIRIVPGAPPSTKEKDLNRGPRGGNQQPYFQRDGWRCRYCGIRITYKDAIDALDRAFPDAVRWRAKKKLNQHGALRILSGSLDHVLPHSRGGTSRVDNLVAACSLCNIGRGYHTLEEVGFLDPRDTPPVIDTWDGLMRLCR